MTEHEQIQFLLRELRKSSDSVKRLIEIGRISHNALLLISRGSMNPVAVSQDALAQIAKVAASAIADDNPSSTAP